MINKIINIYSVKDLLFYRFPPVIWMVIIFPTNDYLSSNSTSQFIIPFLLLVFPGINFSILELIHLLIRKAFHFFNYFCLVFLLYRAFTKGKKILHLKGVVATGIIAISYAILDESIQTVIPSRTGSFYDFLIDLSGCISMLCVIYFKSR